MKARFFAEFEFQGSVNRVYWLPLTIEATDYAEATLIWERLRAGLSRRHTIRTAAQPERILEGINSQQLLDYQRRRAQGRLVPLRVREWRLKNDAAGPEFTFDDLIKLVEQEPGQRLESPIVRGTERRIPVRVLLEGPDLSTAEVLVVDVVLPT